MNVMELAEMEGAEEEEVEEPGWKIKLRIESSGYRRLVASTTKS